MKIGFDFDNTIVCYDKTIKVLSKNLDLPNDLKRDKISIRDYLRKNNREDEWTEFQGLIYGPGMEFASIFDFFCNVCEKLVKNNHQLYIVSHRSRYPFKGKNYDLHFYAQQWIQINLNILNIIKIENIFFLESLNQKILKIEELKLDIFIDDLPEVINHSLFPSNTSGIIFDPKNQLQCYTKKISNWSMLDSYV